MDRISLPIEANIRVNGEQQMKQFSDSIKMSADEMKRFKELGDWTNAREEIQNIEAMKNSLVQLAQEQAKSQNEMPNNYSSKAMQIFDAERKQAERTMDLSGYKSRETETRKQLERYGLDGKRNIENAQKNYRREEILRIYERLGVLNDTMDDLSERMEKAKENNDLVGISRLSMAGENASAEKMSLESKLNRLLNEEKKENDGTKLGKYFGLKELGQVFKFVGDIAQAGYTYRQDIANGNVIGASRREGTSIASGVGNAATAVGGGLMATGVAVVPGAILAGLGMTTNFISRLVEGKGQAGDAEAQAYMNNFDAKYGALRSFREVGGNVATNTKSANEMFSELAAASIGTGLDAGAISQLVQEAARQGVGEKRAFEIASNAGKWNQATGANVDTMLRLQGMAERYGLGQDAVSTAYGGLKASGMQKAQLDEFLNGLQGVIEDGISNGYLKSADDIAAQMTMFASLSGNSPLWQGQNGADKITQMNAGLSGATEMGNAAQSIAMGAAKRVVDGMSNEDFEKRFGHKKTGTYLDYEMALQNPSGEIYGQILKDVKSYSGGNVAAQKEFLQQIFGITSIGTLLDLINMTGGNFSENEYKNVIDKNRMTPNAKTEQTIWADSMGRISESLNKIGEGEWKENVGEIKDIMKEYFKKEEKIQKKNSDDEKRDYKNGLSYSGLSVEGKNINDVGDEILRNASVFDGYNKGGRSLKNNLLDNLLTPEFSYTVASPRNPGEKNVVRKGGVDASDDFIKGEIYKYAAADGNITGSELRELVNKLNGKGITGTEAYRNADLSGLKTIIVSALGEALNSMTVNVQ